MHPSDTGNVSSKTEAFVKFRMLKLSSHFNGQGWSRPSCWYSTRSLRANMPLSHGGENFGFVELRPNVLRKRSQHLTRGGDRGLDFRHYPFQVLEGLLNGQRVHFPTQSFA